MQRSLEAEERWARSDPGTEAEATVAERLDSLVIRRFYHLLVAGMFVRMLEVEVVGTGGSTAMRATYELARDAQDAALGELETQLGEYIVIPIAKLVRVQLGAGILAALYAARR
jgi:hypothetical protein